MQRKEREMGLINKYDFLEKLKASKYHYANDEYKSGYNDGIFHAEVTVDHVPTVYAVTVIRCKDCEGYEDGRCHWWYDEPEVPSDGYCYQAEMIEGDE